MTDARMQARANLWTSIEMAGWALEALTPKVIIDRHALETLVAAASDWLKIEGGA